MHLIRNVCVGGMYVDSIIKEETMINYWNDG